MTTVIELGALGALAFSWLLMLGLCWAAKDNGTDRAYLDGLKRIHDEPLAEDEWVSEDELT